MNPVNTHYTYFVLPIALIHKTLWFISTHKVVMTSIEERSDYKLIKDTTYHELSVGGAMEYISWIFWRNGHVILMESAECARRNRWVNRHWPEISSGQTSDDEFQTHRTFVIGRFCLIGTRRFEWTLMEHLSEGWWNSSVDDRQLTGPWPEVTNLLSGQCPGTLRLLWKGGIGFYWIFIPYPIHPSRLNGRTASIQAWSKGWSWSLHGICKQPTGLSSWKPELQIKCWHWWLRAGYFGRR